MQGVGIAMRGGVLKRLAAVPSAIVLLALSVSSPGTAAGRDPFQRLTIKLERHNDAARPDDVCVCINDSIGVSGALDAATQDGVKNVKAPKPIDASRFYTRYDDPKPDGCNDAYANIGKAPLSWETFILKAYSCACSRPKEDVKAANQVIILLDEVNAVNGLEVSPNSDTVVVSMKKRGTKEVHVKVLDGDYWETPPQVATDTSGGNFFADLALVPRCIERRLRVDTDYQGSGDAVRQLFEGEARLDNGGFDSEKRYTIRIAPDGRTQDELTIRDVPMNGGVDNHTFVLPKGSAIPPHERDIYLETRSFKVTWKIDCLAPKSCPTLHPVDQAVSCSAPAEPVNDVCEWHCSGEIRFPVKMQLTIDKANINDSFQKQEWQSVVSYPGQQLTGYVGESNRAIALRWYVDDWRLRGDVSRAEFAGDKIDYVQIRTPEGRLHRIKVPNRLDNSRLRTSSAGDYMPSWIRVPELNCDGLLTYQYIGTRTFNESNLVRDGDNAYRMYPPELVTDDWNTPCAERQRKKQDTAAASDTKRCFRSPVRNDFFTTGFYIAGGAQFTRFAKEERYVSPGAVFEAILLLRGLNSSERHRGAFRLDLEPRPFVAFSRFPYCAASEHEDHGCKKETHGYWRVGQSVLISLNFRMPFYVGGGAGIGATFTTRKKAARSIPPSPVALLKAHVGVIVSRRFRMELQYVAVLPENVYSTRFDDAGLYSFDKFDNDFTGRSHLLLFGLRMDEIFGGGQD